MADFLRAIAPASGSGLNQRVLSRDPFSMVRQQSGRNSTETRICGFDCDKIYVSVKDMHKLKKHIKYIPLSELTVSACAKGAYFTVGCVCDIDEDRFYLSDLHSAHRVLIASPDHCVIQINDVIAIANAKIERALETEEQKQIIRIGHIDEVEHCSHYGENVSDCSGYVDPRKNPICDFHCKLGVQKARNSRAFLKQDTKFKDVSPESSPQRASIFAQRPLREIPAEFVNQYIGEHSYGRGAKFSKALDRKDAPTIGVGFTPGDIILL